MVYTYRTRGTCTSAIIIDLADDHTVNSVAFRGGCHGNTQGIAALVKGMKAEKVIELLNGIKCGFKSTSCPDQLANALKIMLREEKEGN